MASSRPSHTSLALLLLAATSTAFSPPQSHTVSSTHQHINNNAAAPQAPGRRSPPSPLFMNKKKKQRPQVSNKSTGFASGSSSLTGGTTLIQPKTSSNFKYAGSIRPGLQTPKRFVPREKITFPDYADDGLPKNRPPLFPWVIEVKKPEEIVKMRAAGRCAREVLDLAGREVRVGITT
mmetsp:Transcript_35715/g.64319  ORF Transcript_35715/g.64319 Transcript_35715/m.64319 type:complete len:178 (-) Transcript_35715:5-538(-)